MDIFTPHTNPQSVVQEGLPVEINNMIAEFAWGYKKCTRCKKVKPASWYVRKSKAFCCFIDGDYRRYYKYKRCVTCRLDLDEEWYNFSSRMNTVDPHWENRTIPPFRFPEGSRFDIILNQLFSWNEPVYCITQTEWMKTFYTDFHRGDDLETFGDWLNTILEFAVHCDLPYTLVDRQLLDRTCRVVTAPWFQVRKPLSFSDFIPMPGLD